jgi:cysteine desulfurase
MATIYFDHNATTPLAPEALEAMLPYLREAFGNPSSPHRFAEAPAAAVRAARAQVATLFKVPAKDIHFTSGATESIHWAIQGALALRPERRHLITSAVEHPAVLKLCRHLEQQGVAVTYLPVDREGRLRLHYLEAALRPDTALVSLMGANNETGVLFPIEAIAELTRAREVLLHVDAAQTAGKQPIDLARVPIDLLSFSGHKLHAPKGIGVLYLRRGCRFRPLLRGGHQERGRRAGTENSASIVGLGMACELAMQHMDAENTTVRRLRDRLEQGILSRISHCFPTGDVSKRLPNTSNIAFEYIEGEAILLLLNKMGIAGSSGSACTSGSLEPSHVMRAMGIPYTAAHGTIRFSLSRYNTEEEVDRVIAAVPPIIAQLRKLSPYWSDSGPAAKPEEAFAPTYA